MVGCTILTDEGLHLVTPLAIYCHIIYIPNYILLATEYLITTSPPIPFLGDKKVSVEYSSVILGVFIL